MTPPTVTDTAIEVMLRARGGAMVPSGLEKAIVAAVRAESARAGTSRRRWPARPAFRPALAFALAALLLAAALAAISVGSQNSVSLPATVPSPAPSTSPTASTAADGLILFGISVPVGDGTTCSTFHTIRPDGSGERQLAGGCLVNGDASWSPTGDSIITDSTPLSSSTTQISEVAADGGAPRPLLTLSGGFAPAFSPDGSQMAYAGLGSAPWPGGIFIAAADGTHPQQLMSTPGGSLAIQPRFSPDGSRLVFTRIDDPTAPIAVWMMNTDGTDPHRLTTVLPVSLDARWSSDSSHLLFTGRQTVSARDDGLWTIDADGTGLTPVSPVLTGTGGRDGYADWSPDGSRIVYIYLEPGVESLRVMNADGSGITTLLSSPPGQPDQYTSPDWGLPLPPESP